MIAYHPVNQEQFLREGERGGEGGEEGEGREGDGEKGRQCRVSVAMATTGILLTLYDINDSHAH